MGLIVIGGSKQTAQHSVTKAYLLAKIHWSNTKPGASCTVTDGAGNLVAALSHQAPEVSFNPPKSVTGIVVKGVSTGFLHVYDQEPSGFGG